MRASSIRSGRKSRPASGTGPEDAGWGDRSELAPVASVVEDEGLTLVLPRDEAARHGLAFASTYRRITLSVHSSLDAVGLTAAVSARLTRHGISANVIAGFHHDHIYVQAERADDALAALTALASEVPGPDAPDRG